ncbi:hypothetical protein [uncultured Gimesia sp.]|uniref:hypothetical protein n=1 Tax=uncultured Gimesia sp. TaxID=1678688 RepID=UPI0030DDB7F3|tara:strand:+ start:24125 stop:24457 length:333 start_codon:yes stop_codon:yes gene_type:complete
MTEQFYFAMICFGAAVGMFFAEYFGSTRHREFVFLVFLPSAFSCITTILLLLLQSPDGFDITKIAIWAFLGTVVGIIPAVLSVIVLSILSLIVFRLTGLRFLKFDWNPDH